MKPTILCLACIFRYYYVTDVLGFSTEFLSLSNTLMWAVMLFGVTVAKRVAAADYGVAFFWGQIARSVINLFTMALVLRLNIPLGVPDEVFAIGTDAVETLIGRVVQLPFLTMAAKLTPPGAEATLFACFMSLSNFGRQLGSLLGVWLVSSLGIARGSYDNLWVALALRSALMLVPLPLLRWAFPPSRPTNSCAKKASSVVPTCSEELLHRAGKRKVE
jgi:hypothetical protein